ncbi:hypothetical protein NFJ68_07035 [Klebsiella aerogenes]|uniref:hypothetical protein n=1 Tax=Klebsiella aerogenes TaxID=548 RepID=UPI000A8B63D6|nr:hypothetical protein [Klebsiella aerogenes]HBW7245063.1 hypothetical protein [Klebsiella pneumoniae]QDK16541.1 hypothetical protein ES159_24770 [Klebsiella aerogenes]QSB60054.1 hypothetical protein JW290_10140 [Klebsiella aerogenes]WFW00518.1 hypothetical protein NFJ54_06960 [Klebsiella aerogenes]WFW28192.1 hypothetical protein NFJ68_07035 [Klebsiella aerogenes]
MDNIIISGVRIYFPKPGEKLPLPPFNMPNFAIRGTVDDRCCLLGYLQNSWMVLSLPEYEHSGKAIMSAVRQRKRIWR